MQTLSIISESTPVYQRNLYQEVTNRIITLIEKGVAPWRRTWNTFGLARNYVTGHIYTGINYILLNNTEHVISYFMTFNQIREKGGRVKRGTKAEMVIYFNVTYKDSNGITISPEEANSRSLNGEEIQYLKYIRYFNVYNIGDIEGIEFQVTKNNLSPNESIAECEKIVANMPNRPEIGWKNSDQPYYDPIRDFVNMPALDMFESSAHYYATLFHELVHSTGHPSRLSREGVYLPHKFGTEEYSREEIVAEMGAAFLCAQASINYDEVTESNAAYLEGWLSKLKEDPKFIFKAAAEAQKGVEYMLGK